MVNLDYEFKIFKNFYNYTVENHIRLLKLQYELVKSGKVLESDLGITNLNPYLNDLIDCFQITEGIILWENRFFFLNLVKNLLEYKIDVCEFYHKFTEKENYIRKLAREKENNLDLQKPNVKAAKIYSLIAEIQFQIFDTELDEFCLDILMSRFE